MADSEAEVAGGAATYAYMAYRLIQIWNRAFSVCPRPRMFESWVLAFTGCVPVGGKLKTLFFDLPLRSAFSIFAADSVG